MSPIRVDEDLLPTTVFAIHLTRLNQPAGWLVGEFSLEEMWRMVDRSASASTASRWSSRPDGELIAHGDPDKKALVAQARNMSGHPLVAAAATQHDDAPVSLEYTDDDGRSKLGVAARIAAARLDRHRRAADQRGLRQRHAARSGSSSSPSRSRCSS